MEYILYSTGCPKCKILKKKLDEKGIHYTEIDSVEKMLEIGFTSVPMLDIGGKILDFKQALDWTKNQ